MSELYYYGELVTSITNLSIPKAEPADHHTVLIITETGRRIEDLLGTIKLSNMSYPDYSGTNFMKVLGDDVVEQLITSDDPKVKRILRMFDAVINAGKLIQSKHEDAQAAFDYLQESQEITAFTKDTRRTLESTL